MIKFARALQLGTAEAEQILRHFHADLLSPDGGDLTALPYAARRDALVAPRPGREHVKVPTNFVDVDGQTVLHAATTETPKCRTVRMARSPSPGAEAPRYRSRPRPGRPATDDPRASRPGAGRPARNRIEG